MRHRERQRPRQREKQGPRREPDGGLDPGTCHALGWRQTLNRWATQASLLHFSILFYLSLFYDSSQAALNTPGDIEWFFKWVRWKKKMVVFVVLFCFWRRNYAWVPRNPRSVISHNPLGLPPFFWTLLFLSPRKTRSFLKTLNPVALPILEHFLQTVDVFSTQLSPGHLAWQMNWLAFSFLSPYNLPLWVPLSHCATYFLLIKVTYSPGGAPPLLQDSSSCFLVIVPKITP